MGKKEREKSGELIDCSGCGATVMLFRNPARWPFGRFHCAECGKLLRSLREEDNLEHADNLFEQSDSEHNDHIPEGAE